MVQIRLLTRHVSKGDTASSFEDTTQRSSAAEQGRRNGNPVIGIDYEVVGDPDSRRRT
ncbi:MAG: hypothetical protein GY798_21135 [Hyphomicrobiales bacterium]|nr:hypothetical protein [Hyphomicrobiales bacterium]